MLFGGIAKLNADWLRGEPLRAWLADRTDFPLLGQFFTDEPIVWLMVYGALLADLFFAFYMLNRRTRVFGFILIFAFHVMNSRLFNIGIFPWFMVAATLIFFQPDWPRRVLHDLLQGHAFRSAAFVGGFSLGFLLGSLVPDVFSLVQALIGAIGMGVAAYHLEEPFRRPQAEAAADLAEPARAALAPTLVQRWILPLLGVWVASQVLLPLRHFPIPGKVHWTEEGHNFAWHMKLRDKDSDGFFLVTDPTSGTTWEVDPRDYLNRRQEQKMTSRPYMMVQFARHLEDRMREEGYEDVEIRARISASLNGREPQQLVDPQVDLTKVSYPWFGHADWIVRLEVPLRQASNR